MTENENCGKIQELKVDSEHVSGATNNAETNPVGIWPWMASVGYYIGSKWQHQCGATLITNRHFLTAAHCVDPKYVEIKKYINSIIT